MTSKETTVITLKLFILYIFFSLLTNAPTTATYIVQLISESIFETSTKVESYWLFMWMTLVSIVLVAIYSYILFLLLKSILSVVLAKDLEHQLVTTTSLKFELALISVIGLYYFVSGMSGVTYDIWFSLQEKPNSFFYGMGLKSFMLIISYGIDIFLGLFLMIYPKKVSKLLHTIRRD